VTRHGTAGNRPGLTLIEVLVALAIFLLALGAITRLITFAGQRAADARRTDEASRLARSKMGEVFAGVVPLSSSGDTPFDEEPDYSWSMTADSGSLTGLWVVTVTVKHKADDGPGFSLQKFLPDPTILGSTQDTVTIAGANSSSSSPSSSSSSSSQSGSSQTAAGGGAAAGKGKAAAKPAAGGGSSMPARGGASAAPGRGSMAPSAPSSGGKK
jgi:general secretion pathway protein I